MGHKPINFLTFNVRSLIDKSRQIDLLKTITRNNIDICFIQETHLRANRRIFLHEYNFINSNASVGVAIAIRRNINYKHVSIVDFGFNGVFAEIEIKIDNALKKFLIGSIYIPTNFSATAMNDGLDKILRVASSFHGFILGGDLNAKNPLWGDNTENSNGKNLNNWLQDNTLDVARLCDTSPSYPNGSSYLDHFLVSSKLLNRCNQNFSIESLPSFSDHFPIKLKLNLGCFDFILRCPQIYTSYKNTNWDNFQNDLGTASNLIMPPSNINLKNNEIDQHIDALNNLINATHNSHAEQVEIYDKKKPLSENIEKLYKIDYRWQKDLKKIFHRTGNRISWDYSIISKQLQLLRIILRDLVAIHDSKTFGNKLKKIKPGPRAFKEVNQMMGKKKSSPFCQKIDRNGIPTTNSEEIAETFRSFYTGVFSENLPLRPSVNLNDSVSQYVENVPQHIYSFDTFFNAVANTDNFHFTNAQKLKTIIESINSKKSCGIDEISNFIIKKLPIATLAFLSILFNNCLNNCYFPTAWKSAKIIPIKKKEGSSRVEDFRPISLLSNIGKVFELVIKEKLENSFIIEPIPAFQFGFQRNHSTQHALLKFHGDVCSNLRDKKCTVAISLDIEKAFDSAFHKGILYKLVDIGVDPFLVKLLKSYFTSRKFCVQINRSISSSGPVCSGVPQGSVLAPLLFNIFLHDFPHQMQKSTAILYADDCLIYSHDTSPIQALNKAALHLGRINVYYQTWGIKINAQKSEAICIRNASGKCPRYVVPESKLLQLSLDGVDIPFKTSLKYLGINFDYLFKFNNHARTALSKTKGVCGMFTNLLNSKYLPEKTKLLLYKVALRPILLYGFPIWFAISPSVAKELEILERKIIRKCINKFFQTPTKRFSNVYIYEKSGVTPLCIYAMSLQRKFIEKLAAHDNILMIELLEREKDTNWLDSYLSPVGILNFNLDNPLDPYSASSFFQKVTLGTHRG